MSASCHATALVLKKTKLGEKDVIVTMLADDGRQIRAVAKGARRPGSRLTGSIELFCLCDLLLCTGRSLDTISDARMVEANEGCRCAPEQMAAASAVCELLEKSGRDGDGDPRIFAIANAALQAIAASPPEGLALIVAATLLKVAAQMGFCPSLDACASCGEALDSTQAAAFSSADGGILCEACAGARAGAGAAANPEIAQWVRALIYTRYQDINTADSSQLGQALLPVAQDWLAAHLGIKLRSARHMML